MAKNKSRTIRGFVVPVEGDDDDRISGVLIVTDDEEEYFVEPFGKGVHLAKLVDEYVQVKGIVYNDDGDLSIAVKHFKQIDESEKSEDLEDEDYNDEEDAEADEEAEEEE